MSLVLATVSSLSSLPSLSSVPTFSSLPSVSAALPMCVPVDVACLGGEAAQSAFKAVVTAFGEATVAIIGFLSTFWLTVPSPTIATGGGSSWQVAPVIGQVQAWLSPMTALVAVGSFCVGIGRIAFTGHAGESRQLVRQVSVVGAGTLVVAAGTELLVMAGDQFSPWIIAQASAGGDPSAGLKTMISAGFATGTPDGMLGLWFVVYGVCLLGSIVQCIFMLVRGVALVAMMAMVPTVAAGAASDEGWTRFKRFGIVIVGFALYKPVAAIIYAVSISEMTQQNGGPDNGLQNAFYGVTTVMMAALALPAFIKFLLPAAAVGSSSAFSGGAAVGAVAAAGAAVVAPMAWGAAGAGAAGAGGASATPPTGSTAPTGSTGSTGSGGGAGGADQAGPGPSGASGGASSGASGGSSGGGPAVASGEAAGGAAGGAGGVPGGAAPPVDSGARGRVGAAAVAAAVVQAGAGAVGAAEPEEKAS